MAIYFNLAHVWACIDDILNFSTHLHSKPGYHLPPNPSYFPAVCTSAVTCLILSSAFLYLMPRGGPFPH